MNKTTDHSILELLDSASLVSKTDKQGKITFVNQKFIDVSGYSEKELIGKTHSIVNSGYHPKDFWKGFWSTIGKGGTWQGEVKNKKKNGRYYWVQTHAAPERDAEGNITGYLAIRHDITKEKENEAKYLDIAENTQEDFQEYQMKTKDKAFQRNFLWVLISSLLGLVAVFILADSFLRVELATLGFIEKAFVYITGLLSGAASGVLNIPRESVEKSTTTTTRKEK